MKRFPRLLSAFLLLGIVALAIPGFAPSGDASLDRVLTQMDSAAANFRSLEANFVWDQYTLKPIEDVDTQKGKIYFHRQGNETLMAADITDPHAKYVLFSEGRVQMYDPKIDQVTVYNAGKNRADVESFLVLGFGGRGHDLAKSYDVKYQGADKIDGVETAKLELIPKSEKLRNNIARIVLWVDSARGIALQQQLFDGVGNYRLARYSGIQLNQKLPDGVFKLRTTGKTTVLKPQG
jgi:outer membrane lipoprotein-sorting protein